MRSDFKGKGKSFYDTEPSHKNNNKELKTNALKYPCTWQYIVDKNPGSGVNLSGNSKISIKG